MIGGKPPLVDKIGTIEHEIATNKRFNYSNLSSKASRFVPPKWLVVRTPIKNVPPYAYKVREKIQRVTHPAYVIFGSHFQVDITERSAADFTAYRYNTDCSLQNNRKTIKKCISETTLTYHDSFSK